MGVRSRRSPDDPQRDVGVIIAAAGAGERVGQGEPKQFRTVAGVPLLLRAIGPFARHPRVRHLVVALPPAYAVAPPPWLTDLTGVRVGLVGGGATRAETVRAGLAALDAACTVVLVHDAVRPFVAVETIDAVIAAAARGVGAVPAVAVSDTLKRADAATRRVQETVDRRTLWCAQTPQGFPRPLLEEAYRRAAPSHLAAATDDATLVEALGHPVELVPDSPANFKITTPEDFAIAELLAAR